MAKCEVAADDPSEGQNCDSLDRIRWSHTGQGFRLLCDYHASRLIDDAD